VLCAAFVNWLAIFASTQTYLDLVDGMGIDLVLIVYTAFCLAGFFIIAFYFIEPKRQNVEANALRFQHLGERPKKALPVESEIPTIA